MVVTSCGAPTVHKIMGQIDRQIDRDQKKKTTKDEKTKKQKRKKQTCRLIDRHGNRSSQMCTLILLTTQIALS